MKRNGFTLVEVLVSMGLLTFMLLGVYGVLRTGNALYTTDTVYLDMQQQARNGLDRIVREARESSALTVTVINASSDNLTFTTPNETGIQYYRSSTDLVREYPAGTLKKVASNIAYLKFTLTSDLLLVTIRADKAYGSKTITFPLIEKVRLRNE